MEPGKSVIEDLAAGRMIYAFLSKSQRVDGWFELRTGGFFSVARKSVVQLPESPK